MASTWMTESNQQLRLPAGQALRLRASTHGRLRVVEGCAWATRQGARGRLPDDEVLGRGDALALRRGETLVIEPWCPGQDVRFAWEA